ncbi:MAG TPA: biopolymer transporter ExbD [Terriglobales bacterium]|nr:biopolymer transporter ExbD [Terriglobales bacterium]
MAFSSGGPEMNVTPLIDVLLVLIIIFMLIVPVAPTGEQARIPQEQSGKDEISPVRTIVIQVHQNGGKDTSLRINEEVVTWEALRGRLADIYKERAEKVAFRARGW